MYRLLNLHYIVFSLAEICFQVMWVAAAFRIQYGLFINGLISIIGLLAVHIPMAFI